MSSANRVAARRVEIIPSKLYWISDTVVPSGYTDSFYFCVDRDLVYRFANAAYREWFGVDPDEVVGRPVRDVVGDAAFAVRLHAMQAALAGERA